jgi:methionyl-tRNA synthetase
VTISINDFKEIDLRVGTITHVGEHPNADKLYLFTVDLGGDEERTLVAGLKNYYTPDQLLGKQVAVIANLEAAEVRGVRSEGMLLAAQDGETVSILTTEKTIANGSKIF